MDALVGLAAATIGLPLAAGALLLLFKWGCPAPTGKDAKDSVYNM